MSNLLSSLFGGGTGTAATIGSGDVGVNVQIDVNETAHGFSVGNVLRYSGSGLVLAQADSASGSEADGVVITVTDANNFVFCLFGQASVGAITDDDSNGLTAGTAYYVSETTAGGFTPIQPVGVSNYVKPIFKVTDVASVIIVNPQLSIQGTP